jgi:predicted TIM-barrel fold metal-dependent hydrolase
MIVDFHTHVFPDKIANSTISALSSNSGNKPSTDGTVQGMIRAMDRSGADICVTLPVLTKSTQFDSVARFAKSINDEFKGKEKRLVSFAGMHPDCDGVDEKMSFLKEQGFLGVKIHPDYQSTFIDDDGYLEIFALAKELDMIVVTHSGIDDGYKGAPVKCPPELVVKVLDKIGDFKFVLGHYGAHKQWEQVLSLIAGRNVYLDTAYTLHEISQDLFVKIMDKHGDDKILFATDCPWRDIKNDLEILKSYNLNPSSEQKILYKNALKLLDIKE